MPDVNFDPDAFIASQTGPKLQGMPQPIPQPENPTNAQPEASGFDPDDFIKEAQQERYGTPAEQLKAGLEGLGRGVAGPVAPAVETWLGADPENIRSRAEANPWTHGLGEAAGLTVGMMTGSGEAALMTKAGEAARTAAGLGSATIGAKIGSEAVKQAAEMAVLQGSDEVAKQILQDPDASIETALTNVGLAGVLGGAFGGVTGASGALWSATMGPKVEEAFQMVRNHVNGDAKAVLSPVVDNAIKDLGIEVDPAIRSMLSNDVKARQFGADLMRAEDTNVTEGIRKLKSDAQSAVTQSLGVPLEDVARYEESDAGHDLFNTVKQEFDDRYEPIAEALDRRNSEAAKIVVPDEDRLTRYGKILEDGMTRWGTDSSLYTHSYEWGNRLLAKDTIGGIDQLKTEIDGAIRKAVRADDVNTAQALRDIRSSMADFQEQQIEADALRSGLGPMEAARTLTERSKTNQEYRSFREVMDELTDHLGVGRQAGYKSMLTKLGDKLSPEQLLNKFSPRGNSDVIPFLEKNFPETARKVRENEAKRLLKSSVTTAHGEPEIDYKRLHRSLEAARKGKSNLVDFALPPNAQHKIQAATVLDNALPDPRNSGTPAGLLRLLKHVPTSVMGSVGWLMGHGPLGAGAGALLGHLAEKLGVEAPQAMKLAYLRFLSSDQPVKAEGIKAAVDFVHNAYKGDKIVSRAAQNVFRTGAKELIDVPSSKMPSAASRAGLDKIVASAQEDPTNRLNQDPGHLGHYLPAQQVSATTSSTRAIEYLKSLRPSDNPRSPLDEAQEHSSLAQARYDQALDIAHQPAIVLHKVKAGTLTSNDLKDLGAMYPALAQVMVQKVTNAMADRRAEDGTIPYKTRLGVSLLLGQPMDSTMTPTAIVAAQPIPTPSSPQATKTKRGTSTLGKSNKQYQTPGQASEADQANRD